MKKRSEDVLYLRAYPKGYTPYPSMVKSWQEISKWINKKVGRRDKVLEIGAGICVFINSFRAKEKHALDMWEGIYQFADKDIDVHIRSCTNLGCFNDNYFDLVFAGHLLEHLSIEDVLKTIEEVRRVLKKGGVFVIVQPNFKYAYRIFYDDWTHRTPFTERGLIRILTLKGLKPILVLPKFVPVGGQKLKLSCLPSLVYKIYLALPIRPFAKQMLLIAEKRDNVKYEEL